MEVQKLQKLQKHLETLTLVITEKKDCASMELPANKKDKKRFSINDWQFDCGMPACVAGHAKHLFGLSEFHGWNYMFMRFFNLSGKENNWIVNSGSYNSKNPTPKTAAKHIQDVLDGKFN